MTEIFKKISTEASYYSYKYIGSQWENKIPFQMPHSPKYKAYFDSNLLNLDLAYYKPSVYMDV